MDTGRTPFAQLMDVPPRSTFARLISVRAFPANFNSMTASPFWKLRVADASGPPYAKQAPRDTSAPSQDAHHQHSIAPRLTLVVDRIRTDHQEARMRSELFARRATSGEFRDPVEGCDEIQPIPLCNGRSPHPVQIVHDRIVVDPRLRRKPNRCHVTLSVGAASPRVP
jgi:hypothetical protein